MSLLIFQHERVESAAFLGQVLHQYGYELRVVRLFAADPVPCDLDSVHGVVSLGGSASVEQTSRYPWIPREMDYLKRAHAAGLPVIGLCLGAQLITAALGGEVGPMPAPEAGWHAVKLTFPGTTDPLFAGLLWRTPQLHLHAQEVRKLPPGGVSLASSTHCKVQAFRVGPRTYGFQYHFEWSVEDVDALAHEPLFAQAGVTPLQLRQETRDHYPTYRRLGDRLCHNLATYLFPPDKRILPS